MILILSITGYSELVEVKAAIIAIMTSLMKAVPQYTNYKIEQSHEWRWHQTILEIAKFSRTFSLISNCVKK